MKKWTKSAGLLFMAAASVYFGQAVVAAPGKPGAAASGATPATEVKLLEEPSAKTAEGAGTDAKPSEGRSVSKSEVAVSDEGTVEIHVNDASLVEVLRMLSLQSQKNIICSKDVRGTVTANLYNVTIREALDQILHMNGYAYREKGNFINVYTTKEMQTLEEAERKTNTEVFRLYYTPAMNAMTMIRPVLSNSAQVSATTPALQGIPAGGTDAGGTSHATEDMIVVTDFPDNLDKVRRVLREIDRRPQQVMIEATILRASLSEDNALGIDFNILAGVNFTDFLHQNGQITNAGLGSPATPTDSEFGSIGTGNSFSSMVPGGLKLGFVSDNVSVFLAALEGVTDTTVLANPKVLAVNKQKGEVIVGRKDGYITSTTTQTATVQTVEFLDTGTKLIFRPFVGEDGYIRMELHPEDSSGGLSGANLPFKVTTEMTSNVMVKDGHTIVIGGLFRESSEAARSQVPFLGNLPLAGPLFRNQRDRTSREEVIILITPHIIKDDTAVDALSKDELRKADQLRVGVRKGMMSWGRQRMAEAEYEKALTEYNSPRAKNQKVLWHANAALNLNPKFTEALELKNKVSGKELAPVDSMGVRGLVRRMIMSDKVGGAAPAPAPAPRTETPAVPAVPQAASPQAAPEQPKQQTTEVDLGVEVPLDEILPQRPATAGTDPSSGVRWPTPDNVARRPAEGNGEAVTEIPVEEVKPDGSTADQK